MPPLGYTPLTEDAVSAGSAALLLPWLTLSVLYIGVYARVLRSSLIEAQEEDYVRTARAKGLSERRILLRHALRRSLIAFVSLFGLDFGALVGGGALLTEVVFGLQGVGKLTFDSLQNLDLPVIMGTVMYAAFFVVAGQRRRRPAVRLARPAGAPCLRRRTAAPARGPRPARLVPHRGGARARRRRALALASRQGEVLGIVGESGSGKSVSMLSVMRLIRDPNAVVEGEVLLPRPRSDDALAARDAVRCAGAEIAMIFQDPMTALTPVYRSAGRSPSRCARTSR